MEISLLGYNFSRLTYLMSSDVGNLSFYVFVAAPTGPARAQGRAQGGPRAQSPRESPREGPPGPIALFQSSCAGGLDCFAHY